MNKKTWFWIGGGVILVAIIGYLATGIFPLDIYTMKGISMQPTIMSDQQVGLNKFKTDYKRQDIVILEVVPGDSIVKRIIGLPGERVAIKDGKVFINDAVLDEPYATGPTMANGDVNILLSTDQYYVLGDNRPHSSDSRVFGPVSRTMILGTGRILKD